jgi:hypothetical protein
MEDKKMSKNANEYSLRIPKKYLEKFNSEVRFRVEPIPGLWPVDMKMIREGLLNELMEDKEFNEQFEIAIIPKVS